METLLGVRREDKSRWERRAPLAPEHVRALREEFGIVTVVQPSTIRVFSDEEYLQAGARIDENLFRCNLVVAVKEIPSRLLQPGRHYMYFSHTIKGQPYNMPMLKRLLELRCTLLDHEKVTDDEGRRLVLFGYHAGLAGMIDSLWALGQRLQSEGMPTPLAELGQAHTYSGLEAAETHLRGLAMLIERRGLPEGLGPIVVGVAGYGNVSRGAQHILDLLDPVAIAPEDLGGALQPGQLYKVVFKEEHMVAPKESGESFDLQTYYDHPERFRPIFGQVLDHLTMLVNCIYWEERYPRLVTIERLKELYDEGNTPKLRVIGDISCDVGGSIEATVKATQPDNPVYVFDPHANAAINGVEGTGPVIMAVDNLPCELPREATISFGEALTPLIPKAVTADYETSFRELEVPAPIKRSIIVHKGELTPSYRYLKEHLR
jgi:alpha-aminoadipic semialdehyde synthase